MIPRKFFTAFIFLGFFLIFANSKGMANVLGNPGFEDPIGNGVASNWDSTNGATRVNAATATGLGFDAPPEGSFGLLLTTTAQYTFQTFDQIHPGDFVSFSGLAESAVAAANGGELRIEFKKILGDGTDQLIDAVNSVRITSTNAPAGGGSYVRFTVTGTAPAGTQRVVFVIRLQGANGNIIFDNVNGEVTPASLSVFASKTHVKRGDIVTLLAQFQNLSGDVLSNVDLNVSVPKGIDLVRNSVKLNGGTTNTPTESFVIHIGQMAAGQSMSTSMQIVVATGVIPGKRYEIGFTLTNGNKLSDFAAIRLVVEEAPLFDEGTIIGKVFNDTNQNGVQDSGEKGVPWVRLATEEGIVIITDENGKYHIPAVRPGRHVVKIDGHTLPQGTKFITEESYLVKTTPGLLSKANFAVLLPPSALSEQFQKDLMVSITQGLDTSQPVLGVKMEPNVVKLGIGVLEKEPTFKFQINYPEYVKNWYLEIRDEMGREIWTGFGVAAPPAEVTWSGQMENGLMIRPGIYSYQFKVQDKSDNQDWTPLQFFRVISKADAEQENRQVEIPPVGDFNIFKDGKQTIPLVAKPTLRIQGKTKPGYEVKINAQPIKPDDEGNFQTEIYTTPGDKKFTITAASPDGESTTYNETVKVKDSTFFMTALSEEQMGVNFQDGDLETAGNHDPFRNGFYQDGRLSYYLRGKIKGKFLVKSHYDTADNRSALFRNLDPDHYYPIYGDHSTRDYEAINTQSRLYLVVEMDRSFLRWGSYKTDFNETELSSYNRTLSGLKVHYDTVSTTSYGDPKRGVRVFAAQTQQRADHNEFGATGGSLYYLRHQHVIEGSEKIRVEVRDKIQDIPLHSQDLKEGADYQIDSNAGRIMLSRPLSSVAATDTLVSNDILDGNPVFLIVDYEFDAGPDVAEVKNSGLRGYTYLGNHIRVGGTALEEDRQLGNKYQLRGVDTQIKMGRNTKITAEYAATIKQQTAEAISYNGGLSFANLGLLNGQTTKPREDAYLIKGESKPLDQVDISGYVQGVDPGFSTERIRSQEGLQKYGISSRYKFTETFYARYRFDSSVIENELKPLQASSSSLPFARNQTHTIQTIYDGPKWLAEAEYRHQDTDRPVVHLLPNLLSEVPFENGLTGRVGYHINERLLPYAKVQTTISGKPDHQFGGGVRYQIQKDLFGYIEQMIGNLGDSTYFGFEKNQGLTRSYVNLRSIDRGMGIGTKTLATTIGSSFALSEHSRVFSEREHSTYQGEEGYSDIYGYDTKVGDHWGVEAKLERRHRDNATTRLIDQAADQSLARTNSFNTATAGISYVDGKKIKARTALEIRRDSDTPKLWQWVTRNALQYQINPDVSYLGKLDFGTSRFTNPGDTAADFMELSTGFAYRPVDNDRLNILSRYSYLRDLGTDPQYAELGGIQTTEIAHIISLDIAYDLTRYFGLAEKLAYKISRSSTNLADDAVLQYFLWINRINFHVTRKWDVALEYRTLWQFDAGTSLDQGALVEIDREIYDYVRLGVGYNFTDFADDLRKTNNYNSHGPFMRLTGKF